MKSILAFGDSLMWGFIPGTRDRYPHESRWPNVLQKGLGENYAIYQNALNARTTVHDNPFRDHRNGLKSLPMLLEVHAPLDLVILALGTNDFHRHYNLAPFDVARGMRRLVHMVKSHQAEPMMPRPKVLIISPPKIVPTEDEYFGALFGNTHEIFHELGPLYQKIAEEEDIYFFDAGNEVSASPIDGVHLTKSDTIQLGKALINPISKILTV